MPDAPTPNSMPGAQVPAAEVAQTTDPAGAAQVAQTLVQQPPTPPWGGNPADFDPDKAAKLIDNLRASEDKSKGTIASQRAEIEALQAKLASPPPQVAAEPTELATARKDMQELTDRLSAVEKAAQSRLDTALQAKAEALASNRDADRAGSAFVNPKTAAKLIDLSSCLTEGGDIDETAIASKLDALAQTDPYLIAQATAAGRKPNPGQGQGGGSIPAASTQKLAEQAGDIKGAINAVAQNLYQAATPPQF